MNWRLRARCRDLHPDIFFPKMEGGRPPTDGSRLDKDGTEGLIAKKFCAPCPVIKECREWALANREFGVWGGTTENERLMIRRRRKEAA